MVKARHAHSVTFYLYLLFAAYLGALSVEASASSKREEVIEVFNVDCDLLRKSQVVSVENPIDCSRLRTVSFTYLGYDQQLHQGQFVVIDAIAKHVKNLMNDLLRQNFPISKAQPMRVYRGDDQASMDDNNSSAFNGRPIKNSSRWSMHAYGAAIDINPLENPYIEIEESGLIVVSPSKGARYSVNRSAYRPNKVRRQGLVESVVDVFAHHGFFIWGGDWNYPIDYQHFQFGPRSYIEKIAALRYEQSVDEIDKNIALYRKCRANLNDNELNARKICVEQVLAELEGF